MMLFLLPIIIRNREDLIDCRKTPYKRVTLSCVMNCEQVMLIKHIRDTSSKWVTIFRKKNISTKNRKIAEDSILIVIVLATQNNFCLPSLLYSSANLNSCAWWGFLSSSKKLRKIRRLDYWKYSKSMTLKMMHSKKCVVIFCKGKCNT